MRLGIDEFEEKDIRGSADQNEGYQITGASGCKVLI